MIRELRMELAKHNPMSSLLHGTRQQEYGLLLEKTRKLTLEHSQLEKSIRDMYIEKDMLAMDLEAMNDELKYVWNQVSPVTEHAHTHTMSG